LWIHSSKHSLIQYAFVAIWEKPLKGVPLVGREAALKMLDDPFKTVTGLSSDGFIVRREGETPATRAAIVIGAQRIQAASARAERGAPKYIRSDNGPEFIAKAVVTWLRAVGVGTLFIEPGSPWENAYGESFNGRLEDELLGSELFSTLAEARDLAEMWRREYNTARPHSSLGYQTPAEFAAQEPSTRATLVASGPKNGVKSG
jgi:transposase InsO family protein